MHPQASLSQQGLTRLYPQLVCLSASLSSMCALGEFVCNLYLLWSKPDRWAFDPYPIPPPRNVCTGLMMYIQHLFPRLPPEIRIKIWNFSLPEPRIVEVRCGSDAISDKCPNGPGLMSLESLFGDVAGCRSAATIPVTLGVCRESRAETLRRYKPMFGFAGQPGRVYFDPQRDVLYFGRKGCGLMGPHAQFRTVFALCESDLARVCRIAVDEAVLGPVSPGYSEREEFAAVARAVYQLLAPMVRLPALGELIFVSKTAQRRFDPEYCPVSEPSPETVRDSKSLPGAIGLALQDMSVAAPLWHQPVWNVFSRKSFA